MVRSTTCVRRLDEFRRACARSLAQRLEQIEAAVQAMCRRPGEAGPARDALGLLQGFLASAGPLGFGGALRPAAAVRAAVQACVDANPGDLSSLHDAAIRNLEDLRRHAGLLEAPAQAPADARPRTSLLLVSGDAGLSDTLSHYGYDVRRCASLDEAPARSFPPSPSALVVDAAGDPAAALEQIRRRPHDLPVLLLTDRDDLRSRIEAVRAGIDAVFVRPGEIGALIDRLGRTTAVVPAEPVRVLLVDDDPVAAGLHAAALRSAGMRVRTVSDPLAVMEPLRETTPDLLLLDMDMGVCTGDELAAAIRQHDEFVGIPIVFLSSETATARQLAARSAGADDFLVKPVLPQRLVAEVTLRAERARTLRAHMLRDGQTGVLNQSAFLMQLRLEVGRARRAGRRLALARVDIDRFRLLNERLGHVEGDRAIRDLARLLQKRLRSTDLVGRAGGDRFLALLGDASGEAAASVLDEIRRSFAELRPSSTLRAGIASFPAQPDAELMLEAAEKALARAARAGGDRVEQAPE